MFFLIALERLRDMNIKYFTDTDTLYLVFSKKPIVETKDLDENVILDLDDSGKIVAITIEHAKENANIAQFSFEQVNQLETAS